MIDLETCLFSPARPQGWWFRRSSSCCMRRRCWVPLRLGESFVPNPWQKRPPVHHQEQRWEKIKTKIQ